MKSIHYQKVDLTFPDLLSNFLATLLGIIKENLPENSKISVHGYELIIKLCNDFVYHLSNQSNNVCLTKNKKTISTSHVIQALKVKKPTYSDITNSRK
jgi:hypothetical protein